MSDCLLGGSDNYEADWAACGELLRIAPNARRITHINRQFLMRAVKYLASAGIGQYIDHGAGLPARENVHEVAQRVNRSARVLYVDNDPMVLAHARMMLEENCNTSVLGEDIAATQAIFDRVEGLDFLTPSRPAAALFGSVLHCLSDEKDPWRVIRDVAERIPSGSYLVISHLASEDACLRDEVTALMHRVTSDRWGRVRSFAEVDRFFEGLEIVGHFGNVAHWGAGAVGSISRESMELIQYGGVARVP
jgi:hypothetical protein